MNVELTRNLIRFKKARILLFILPVLILVSASLTAQTVDFRGYVKELGSISANNDFGVIHYDNILHHRHETTVDFSSNFTFQVDLRTRLLSGYSVQNTPGYTDYLAEDPGFADMSWVLVDSKNAVLHSTIDRLQLQYYNGPWDITLGRQRLNWSKTNVWNPNDLFNAFAYLDFDYEERPGSDALSVQYSWSYASSVSFGYGFGDSWDESIVAAMYRGNLGDYDVQAIAGSYKDDWVIGGGWSGYLKDAGFSGEVSYFWKDADDFFGDGTLTASLGGDYMFSNGLFLNAEVLWNGGFESSRNALEKLVQPPSPSNLFIEKTGYFVNGSFAITPLINGSLGTMGSFTQEPMLILIPQLSFSVTENLDFLVLSQLLKGEMLKAATPTPNLFFFRLKWSY